MCRPPLISSDALSSWAGEQAGSFAECCGVIESVVVRVPGSTSNLGAGFDCVGMAVDRWLTVTVRRDMSGSTTPKMVRHGTLETLNGVRPERDTIFAGFRAACTAAGTAVPPGLVFEASSEIPVGRGIGSSAAAAVAGAALANAMLSLRLDARALAGICAVLEGHPDNVAPSVYGGAVLALGDDPLIVSPLEVHPSLVFVFAVPDFSVETKRARGALPNVVPHVTAVQAAARSAALVRGLATGEPALLAAALDDVLHVPHRRGLVRGYDAVNAAATAAGAFGATLSGSGSSIVAIAPTDDAAAVESAMAAAWQEKGIANETFHTGRRVRGYEVQSVVESARQWPG
jgi:homoserine kinase